MQLFTLTISLILLSIPKAYLAVVLVADLKKACPMMSEIKSKFESQLNDFESENPNETFPKYSTPEYCQMMNFDELMRILFLGIKGLRIGPSEMVYDLNYIEYIDPSTHRELQIASKVVRFLGDGSRPRDSNA